MNHTTLYVIADKDGPEANGITLSLKRACDSMGLTYAQILSNETELNGIASMRFEAGSLLYRVSTGAKASIIEPMLVVLHPGVFTTIYEPRVAELRNYRYRELCEQMARGLQIIPTLIVDDTWQGMDRAELERRVQQLGGFPVVAKMLGFSHGAGVQKVDDLETLVSLLLQRPLVEGGTIMLLRKYLANYRHLRLIVVDGKVVACIEYHKPADDFRTNAAEQLTVSAVSLDDLDPRVMQLALDGVGLRSSILGGVDILIDLPTDTPYLAEVNVPCYYARAEGPTGVDISGRLLEAMMRKRDRSQA